MSSTVREDQGLLRVALRANAAFSGLSGIVMLFGAGPLAVFIGFAHPWLLRFIGVSLVVFALTLIRTASRRRVDVREAWTAVALDGGWVVGSAIIIAMGFLNGRGNWTLAFVSDFVLLFAILQFVGLRISSAKRFPASN